MANCAVCGRETSLTIFSTYLCADHYYGFCKWFHRWTLSTGHRGPINMKPEKIVNMLKNMDSISKVKRAKV